MKKLALTLALLLCLSLAACGKAPDASSTVPDEFLIPDPDLAGEPVVLKQFADPEGPIATIKTSMGDVEIMLFPKEAPKAVENFVTHAKAGYYDGLTFHRVINGFMLQGGDPTGTGSGGESIWGNDFEDEFSDSLRNYRGALSMANAGQDTNGSQFFIVQSPTAAGLEGYAESVYSRFLVHHAYKRIRAMSATITDQAQLDKYLAAEQSKLDAQVAAGATEEYIKRMEPVVAKYNEVGGTPYLDGKHTVFGQVTKGMDIVDAIAAVQTSEPGVKDKPVEDVVILSITIAE